LWRWCSVLQEAGKSLVALYERLVLKNTSPLGLSMELCLPEPFSLCDGPGDPDVATTKVTAHSLFTFNSTGVFNQSATVHVGLHRNIFCIRFLLELGLNGKKWGWKRREIYDAEHPETALWQMEEPRPGWWKCQDKFNLT